jgi:hypothetical protein
MGVNQHVDWRNHRHSDSGAGNVVFCHGNKRVRNQQRAVRVALHFGSVLV